MFSAAVPLTHKDIIETFQQQFQYFPPSRTKRKRAKKLLVVISVLFSRNAQTHKAAEPGMIDNCVNN